MTSPAPRATAISRLRTSSRASSKARSVAAACPRPLAHLVEAVTQVGLALQGDRDRDQRPDDGQDDRRVQLGPDRHPAAAA
jgi:hypothetical protein